MVQSSVRTAVPVHLVEDPATASFERNIPVRSGIHPDYHETTVTCGCGNQFTTRSTAREAGVHRADPRSGVDVHHGRDSLGDPVARGVACEPGAAVHGEHDGSLRSADRVADRDDVVSHGDRGSVGVGGLETGQRHGRDVVAVATQRGHDLVPRPRAEPEPGNKDNRCGSHSEILVL